MKMKVFRDYSQPFRRRTRSKKLGVLSVLLVVCFCVGSSLSEKSTNSTKPPKFSKSFSDFPSSANVITTNFASLKNHTFKINASKKYYLKYAASTTTTTVAADSTTTGTTTSTTTTKATKPTTTLRTTVKPTTSKATASPTTTRTTSELPPPPPPTPLIPPLQTSIAEAGNSEFQNSTLLSDPTIIPQPQPLIQELDLDVPDQVAEGSDHFMNVIAAPPTAPSQVAQRRSHDVGNGFMPPSPTGGFPNSFAKFGVQDSLLYKNEIASTAPGTAGLNGNFGAIGGGPSSFSQSSHPTHQTLGGSAHSSFGGTAQSSFIASSQANFGGSPPSNFAGSSPLNSGGSPQSNFAGSSPSNFGGSPQPNSAGSSPSHFGGSPASKFRGSPQSNFDESLSTNFGATSQSNSASSHSNFDAHLQSNFGEALQSNFGTKNQPARLATTFQHSGGFTGDSNFNNIHNTGPPQPTSGGAYQFPSNSNGLHEINPFSTNHGGEKSHSHDGPNPNVQSYSPYSTLEKNRSPGQGPSQSFSNHQSKKVHKSPPPQSSHFHGSNGGTFGFPQSSPSVPSKFPAANSVSSYSQANIWQPSAPKHRGPVYPGHGGPTRRSDRVGKELRHHEIEKSDEEGPTAPSPHFGSANNFGPQDSPSFLGSFDAGDLPNVIDNHQQQQDHQEYSGSEDFGPAPSAPEPPVIPVLRPQGFVPPHENSPPHHHTQPQGGPEGFSGFDPPSSAGMSGIDGSQSHSPQENTQNHEPDFQDLKLQGPPLNEFNAKHIPRHNNHNQHAPNLNSPSSQQHHPSSHKSKQPGFRSLSSIEQGFGDFGGFTGGTIPPSQANSGQEDTEGYDNFQGGHEQADVSPQGFQGPLHQNSPQFPTVQNHFDAPQQHEHDMNGFHNAPSQGSSHSQPHQGFGHFHDENQPSPNPNGFSTNFGAGQGQGHDPSSLPPLQHGFGGHAGNDNAQPHHHPPQFNSGLGGTSGPGFGGHAGNDNAQPHHHPPQFNPGLGGNSGPGFPGFNAQPSLNPQATFDSRSSEGRESAATSDVENDPPQHSDSISNEHSQGQEEATVESVSEEGEHHGHIKHSSGPTGFGGPISHAPPSPQLHAHHPAHGFGGFSNDPTNVGASPPQHQNFEGFSGNAGQLSPQYSGGGGFSNGPSIPGTFQNQNQGHPHSNSGGFHGQNNVGHEPPQHAPQNIPDQTLPGFGFQGFSNDPSTVGVMPTQNSQGHQHSSFGGYSSDQGNVGGVPPPQHSHGHQHSGFGEFSNSNSGVSPNHHSQSHPNSGFDGFPSQNHLESDAPQNNNEQGPQGPEGFPTPPQHTTQSFGFGGFPPQLNHAPQQQVQGHPSHDSGASNQHGPSQNSHNQHHDFGRIEEIQPGPPPPLHSVDHGPQGPEGFSPGQQQLHNPQSHFSHAGSGAFEGGTLNHAEQGAPEQNEHQNHPGFQGFGNFPGQNAELALKPDEAPQGIHHDGQGSFGGSQPPINHPTQPPQIISLQSPPQVVTFNDPPQVGFQDTETSASNSDEHSIEQRPPAGFNNGPGHGFMNGPGPGFMNGPAPGFNDGHGFNGFGQEHAPFQGGGPSHHPSHHPGHGAGEKPHNPVDELQHHHPGLGPPDTAIVNIPGAGFVGNAGAGGPSSSPGGGGGSFGSPFNGPGPFGIGPVGPGFGPIGNSQGSDHHGHHQHHSNVGHHPGGGHGHFNLHHKPGIGLGALKHVLLSPLKLLGGLKKPLGGSFKFFGGLKPIHGPVKSFGDHKNLGPVKVFGNSPLKNNGGFKTPNGPIKVFKNPVIAPLKALGGLKHAVSGPVKGFVGDLKKPFGPVKGFGVGIGHGGGPLKGLGLVKGLLHEKGKYPLDHKIKYILEKVIRIIFEVAHKILSFYAKLSIPKDHYLRVISFAGIYLLFGWLLKDSEHLLYPKCEKWGWNGPEEFTFHAPARFVPAPPVDPHMQQEFLDLFRGLENCLDKKVEKDKKKKKKDKKKHKHKDKHRGKGSSSEEDEEEDDNEDNSLESNYRAEIGFINEMCPRGQFFYSMSPYHIEAWTALARMFVEQKTPGDVLHLARTLLHDHSVNPKVWYLALQAAAVERPDMTGFSLAHPLDAMPDMFVPGHLIEGEWQRYRGLLRVKRSAQKINGTSSSKIIQIQKRSGAPSIIATSNITTTSRPSVALEKLHAIRSKSNSSTIGTVPPKYKSMLKLRRKGEDDGDDGEDTDEDDEIDEDDDDDDDDREDRRKKKHPLGYGHGSVGDGYGTYKNKQQGGDDGDGGGGLLGGLFGGNRDKGKDKYKSKEKGKGKGKKGKKGKGKKKDKKKCIIVDGSVGLDNGIENKLWYWREDMMVNQHHWYWHQIYPVNATMHGDRRAELFFYMHRSMLARYNAERLSNGFSRTLELGLYPGAIIDEPYNPHLKDFNSGSWWTPRGPATHMTDILHLHDPDYARDIIVNDVVALYNSFVKAIKLGKLLTADGKFLPIRFHEGIQPLANTIEATNISVNPFYYDAFGLHNLGHILVGLAADPDYSKQLPSGIMSEAAVSMRDPAFYTYHTILDNLFDKFKKTLPPYRPYGGVWPLQWHGVDIVDIKLVSHGGGDVNHLTTFYIKHKFQLEPGVDRSIEKGIEKAEVCAVHLDHAPFQFQIAIDRKRCAKSKSGQGTVRIFMAPRYNEDGHRLPLVEQRRLMFQLDAFQVELKIGRNLITRNSRDNALTKPWSRSLKEYERGPDPSGAADYCGCGWPHHLFIPKGNTHGMAFDLFVMVTNFDEDFVADHPADLEIPERCNSPYIFCGLPRRRYPDSRPMGYPFDRPPYHVPAKPCGHGHKLTLKDLLCKLTGKLFTRPAATLEEYVKGATNMAMTVFEIKHIPKVVGKHYG